MRRIYKPIRDNDLPKTFQVFYEKMPKRHVKPTIIKGHLSCIYDA